MNNSQHYDSITKAWQFMLGKNFHWGYFNNDNENLEIATENLISKMLDFISLNKNSKILDIGCGIGTPALYINKLFNCSITGISNSPEGIKEANQNAKSENVSDKVQFFVKDALDNGFEENSFDVCWLMEMSHLLEDKFALIKESIRPLKKGGQVILCDLMFRRVFTAKEIFENKPKLIKLADSFGQARIETFEHYKNIFELNNLSNIKVLDISDKVTTTLIYWKKNVVENYETINKYISQVEIDNFIYSCDVLTEFYKNKIWGYGIIYGEKK